MLLGTLRCQLSPLRLDLGKTGYKHLVLARSEFLKLIVALNESLRLIIKNYMLRFTFRIKTTLLDIFRSRRSPLNARFRSNWL